jgi:hypothetical protein
MLLRKSCLNQRSKEMKKGWKWVIGIAIGLVVLAILAGVFFMVSSHYLNVRMGFLQERGLTQGTPWQDGSDRFNRQFGPGMMGQRGFRHPGMMGYGLMPWGGLLGGLIGGLVRLGILVLVVLGVIWLVKSLRTKREAVPAATVTTVPQEFSAAKASCTRCGHSLETDWKVCPNCGKKV